MYPLDTKDHCSTQAQVLLCPHVVLTLGLEVRRKLNFTLHLFGCLLLKATAASVLTAIPSNWLKGQAAVAWSLGQKSAERALRESFQGSVQLAEGVHSQ